MSGVAVHDLFATGGAFHSPKLQTELMEVLSGLSRWTFNVFELEKLCDRPLCIVVWALLDSYSALSVVEPKQLRALLIKIESSYSSTNKYHNNFHGADVAHTMTYLLSKGGICSALKLTVDEVFASIMAAAVHDVAHPGVNNAYLIESNDLLAIRYNDKSPLESMHAAFMFEAMCDPAFDALKNCSRVRRKAIRRLIVSMVLATDNANHTEYLSKLNTRLLDDDRPLSESRDDKCLCLQIVLHTSDVSNPAKSWDYYVAWTDRIMEEFYAQGDAERAMGYTVTPFLDRTKPIPQPNFQSGFIKAIVRPLFSALHEGMAKFGVDVTTCLRNLDQNLSVWTKRIESANSVRRDERNC